MARIPSSAALIAAAQDQDLLERMVALGATMSMGRGEITEAMSRLAATPVDDTGDNTIASVHEYAAVQRAQALAAVPPPPGQNYQAVTDAHILYALNKFKNGAAGG